MTPEATPEKRVEFWKNAYAIANEQRWIIHGQVYESMSDAEAKTGIDMSTIFDRVERGVPGYEKRSVYE